MRKVLFFLFALVSFLPVPASAQTPTLGYFAPTPTWPHPFKFPCRADTGSRPEFHPLRPYPGNPCDPLIPRKIPEAPNSTDPAKSFLTFNCAKSLNVSGIFQVKDVVDICGKKILTNYMPPSVINNSNLFPLNLTYDAQGNSEIFQCSSDSTDVCQVKRISWAITIDLSSVNLPVMGNTETVMSDVYKVNIGLDWYLNGSIYQSEKMPLNGLSTKGNLDIGRIVNYSGPINKLIPKDLRNYIKTGDPHTHTPGITSTQAGRSKEYHNYLVACQRNLDIQYLIDTAKSYVTTTINNLQIYFQNTGDTLKLITDFILDIGTTFINHAADISTYLTQVSNVFRDLKLGNGMAENDFIPLANTYLKNISFDHLANDGHLLFIMLSNYIQFFENISLFFQSLSLDVAESCTTSNVRWRLSKVDGDPQPWIMRYVPYATLEDVTSEMTVSVIPKAQPIYPEIDGTIVSIGLSINTGTDSRLYFPHLKSALALSQLLTSFHTPVNRIVCGHDPLSGLPLYCNSLSMSPTPSPPFHFSPTWTSQKITLHQGLDDDTRIEGETNAKITVNGHTYNPGNRIFNMTDISLIYSQGRLIRNTEMREGYPAPPPLYTPVPQNWRCDPSTRTNNIPGDSLLGQKVYGTLTYYQLFRYSPKEVIDCQGIGCYGKTGSAICVTKPCIFENQGCNITDRICCTDEILKPYPGYGGTLGNCPYTTECQLADSDFQCVPSPIAIICQTGAGVYGQQYPYSCTDRYGVNHGICCGPRADPVYGPCRGKTVCSCRGSFYCPSRTNSVSCTATLGCYWYCVNYNNFCSLLNTAECSVVPQCTIEQIYPGHTAVPVIPVCPAWPYRDLKTAARVNPFTKTPLVEKLYDLLVVNPQSLLHRWLPQIPLSATDSNSIKIGRDHTLPAKTTVGYFASVATSSGITGTRVTAGSNSAPALFFPHLGSLSDYILGIGQDNYNIQCIFRPKGQCRGPVNSNLSLCKGEAYQKIAGLTDAPAPIPLAQGYFESYIVNKLTPDLIDAYGQAEAQTGVPCEVLAGIHFEEGDLDPNRNLQNGGPLSGTLADSAIAAAKELLTHACPSFTGAECDIPDLPTLVQALSWYNGGGNRNCQDSSNCAAAKWPARCGQTVACASSTASCVCHNPPESGSCRATCSGSTKYPYSLTPNAGLCPPPYVGFDDPYATNWWQTIHQNMYVLLLYDCTFTPPTTLLQHPGALPVAIMIYNSELKP